MRSDVPFHYNDDFHKMLMDCGLKISMPRINTIDCRHAPACDSGDRVPDPARGLLYTGLVTSPDPPA